MPITVIAKKSCRVMIEPPRKARATTMGRHGSVPAADFLSGESQARKTFFMDKPSLPPRGIEMMMKAPDGRGNDETSARAATATRQGLSGQSA